VAFAMVQLGLTMEGVATALDLDEGLEYLNQKRRQLLLQKAAKNQAVGDILVDEIRVLITMDQDIVGARQQGRALAVKLEFSPGESTLIATAISELARNIVCMPGVVKSGIRLHQNGSGRAL